MNHAKISFSTETFAGEIIGAVQYLAPLRYQRHVALKHLPLYMKSVWHTAKSLYMHVLATTATM
jgi:hypothetical protein